MLCGVAGQPVGAADDRHKWWLSETSRAELGLSDQQSSDLDAVFQSVLPRMKAEKDELVPLQNAVGVRFALVTNKQVEDVGPQHIQFGGGVAMVGEVSQIGSLHFENLAVAILTDFASLKLQSYLEFASVALSDQRFQLLSLL